MANTKEYQIKINGITESINAIDSLNNKLQNLEQRINAINSTKVSSAGGTSRTSNASSLSEEEAIQREINKLKEEGQRLDAKIAASQDEIYKRVDATKQLYKEVIADQKSLAAQERLQADTYNTNTMQGMKERLADLKSVINTTDLGDTDKLKQLTEEANKLNAKLLEVEKSYGQFGRNVGNYPDAAKNLQAIVVTIGGVDREFNNAREATKTLNNELKAMAVQGKQNTKEYEELRQKILELESTLNDAKKPMDGLMDTMESITAIASVSKGLGAFFGVDTTEIQKSMQQLLALQTALKGLQAISKQIETREGIGKWIAPFNVGIDKATAKLLTFNTALLGTGKAAKTASIAIKGFSKALKVAFSAGVLIVVDLLIEGVMKLVESFKKVDEAAEREKAVQKDLAEAYGNAQGKLIQYKTKVDEFNGSKKEEKKLVEELNKEFGETLGTYNSLAKWQDVLKKKGDAYIQTLINQAKAQAALNEVTAAYMNLEDVKQKRANGDYSHWYQSRQQDAEAAARAEEDANKRIAKAEENLRKIVTENDKYAKDNKLGDYAPQIKKNTKNTEDALKNAQNSLNNLQLRLMQDGLNKKLRQLDEEERQTLDKLKKIGKNTANLQKKVQETYNQLRLKETKDYLKKLEETIEASAKKINSVKFEINTKDIDIELDSVKNRFEEMSKIVPSNMNLTSRADLKNIIGDTSIEDIRQAYLFDISKLKGDTKKYQKVLNDFLAKQKEEKKAFFEAEKKEIGENAAYDWIAEKFEKDYAKALSIVRSYNIRLIDLTEKDLKKNEMLLSNSFRDRLFSSKLYYEKGLKLLSDNIREQSRLNAERINSQKEADLQAEKDRYNALFDELQKNKDSVESTIATFKVRNKKDEELLAEMKENRDKIYTQLQEALDQHLKKMQQIKESANNALEKNELDTQDEISSAYEKYYNLQITNYREFQSKLNDEMNKNPIAGKNWGIVNVAETKRNYREVITASETTLRELQKDKEKLNKDYKGGLISDAVFNETLTNFNDLEKSVTQGLKETNEKSKMIVADFIQSIDHYLQEVVGSFNQIMQAVWNSQDITNEKEAEALDKQNEILEDKLRKQQEIVEQHKSKIDSIEDELSTARGDRRQHLIDQLNAEMAAQREAQAQEKKIQKEKKALEDKQDALEKKRKEQQYDRDMLQAVVNGAMAVTYALVNKWPVPAIPMAALAASTAAAQIGIMAANKPFRVGGQLDGGLVKGKRHSQGGVPVGATGIEVEGDEMIIRRESTIPNIDLLNYINKSQRKLDLDDFIDFYSSGKVKNNIRQMTPKTKYADGGVLTLPSSIDINDRLLDAFEAYSNRPVVVDVREITSKQESISKVETLAGLR